MELLLVALGVGVEERFELDCAGHGRSFAGHGESIIRYTLILAIESVIRGRRLVAGVGFEPNGFQVMSRGAGACRRLAGLDASTCARPDQRRLQGKGPRLLPRFSVPIQLIKPTTQ